MKKGIVHIMHLSHKNGRTVLNAGDKVTENDVNNFDKLVKQGKIKESETDGVDEDDLMKLLKDDLQAKCEDLKIDFNESDTKAELVEKILNSSK